LIRPNRRLFTAGLAAGAAGIGCSRSLAAFQLPVRSYRGLYRPPGYPSLADDPVTEFLADAWHFDGSLYNSNQGVGGAPLWGLSLRGYPYRTQFVAFTPTVTTAGQGCGFNGSTQYLWTSIGAGRGPWSVSPAQQTMLVVAQVNAIQTTPQTLMGIEGHAIPRRASLQIAANSTNFFLNWVTTTTTTGNFLQSVQLGQPFAAALTLDYASGIAGMFFGQTKNEIFGSIKSVNQWDEANFGNSVVNGINQGNFLNGAILFAASWNIILSDSTLFGLLRDPFGFLIFPDDQIMSEIGGMRMATSLSRGAHGFPR
jgi:hypothetical protein